MKIFIIAGESSGDNIASLVLKQLNNFFDGEIKLKGVAGSKLESLGLRSLFPMSQINLMGFFEVIPHILKLRKLINYTAEEIIKFNPDILITVDSPGFAIRVAKLVKNKFDGKMIHIVAPSVWAYNPARAKTFAKYYDMLFAMLPFEVPFFENQGLPTKFVGHFSFEESLCRNKDLFRKKYNIPKSEKIVCLTPGSRISEVKRHMPIFKGAVIKLIKKHKIRPVFLAANNEIKDIIKEYITEIDRAIVTTQDKFELYKAATICLAKSGTNSLEIALHGTPQVIAYRLNIFSWFFIKWKMLIKYANLINIVANKEIIPELIQNDFNEQSAFEKLDNLLSSDEERIKQTQEVGYVLDTMKNLRGSPSKITASEIINLYNNLKFTREKI